MRNNRMNVNGQLNVKRAMSRSLSGRERENDTV